MVSLRTERFFNHMMIGMTMFACPCITWMFIFSFSWLLTTTAAAAVSSSASGGIHNAETLSSLHGRAIAQDDAMITTFPRATI